jgi:hypothetical protein
MSGLHAEDRVAPEMTTHKVPTVNKQDMQNITGSTKNRSIMKCRALKRG